MAPATLSAGLFRVAGSAEDETPLAARQERWSLGIACFYQPAGASVAWALPLRPVGSQPQARITAS